MVYNYKTIIKKDDVPKDAIETMQKDLILGKKLAAQEELNRLRMVGLSDSKKTLLELQKIEKIRKEIEERNKLEVELKNLGIEGIEKNQSYIEIESEEELGEKEKAIKGEVFSTTVASFQKIEKEKVKRDVKITKIEDGTAVSFEAEKVQEGKVKEEPQKSEEIKKTEEKPKREIKIIKIEQPPSQTIKESEQPSVEKIQEVQRQQEIESSKKEQPKEEQLIEDTHKEDIYYKGGIKNIEELRKKIKNQIQNILNQNNNNIEEVIKKPTTQNRNQEFFYPKKEPEIATGEKQEYQTEKESLLSFKKRVKIRPWKSDAELQLKRKDEDTISKYREGERIIIISKAPAKGQKIAIRFLVVLIMLTVIFLSISLILFEITGRRISDYVKIPAINIQTNFDIKESGQNFFLKILDMLIKGPEIKKTQQPTEAEERNQKETTIPPIQENIIPQYEENFIKTDGVKFIFYNPNTKTINDSIKNIKNEVGYNQLLRIVVYDNDGKEVYLKTFLESTFTILPKVILENLNNTYQLYIFKKDYNSLNLLIPIKSGLNENDVKQSIMEGENDLPLGLAPLVETVAKNPGNALGLVFKTAKINNVEIRYVTFQGSESGVVWTIYKNYFIISTHSGGLLEIINRLNLK